MIPDGVDIDLESLVYDSADLIDTDEIAALVDTDAIVSLVDEGAITDIVVADLLAAGVDVEGAEDLVEGIVENAVEEAVSETVADTINEMNPYPEIIDNDLVISFIDDSGVIEDLVDVDNIETIEDAIDEISDVESLDDAMDIVDDIDVDVE